MNRLPTVIRFVLASATATVMVLSGIAVAQTSSGEVTIAGFDLLSSKRVGRTTFEYEYGVNVQNGTSTDVTDVSVTVSSSTTGVTVIDDSATIGAIASGTTATSGDTITVEVDRRVSFDPNQQLVATTSFRVTEQTTGVSVDVPDTYTAITNDAKVSFFSPSDIEYQLPPILIMRIYEVPDDISSKPMSEALIEIAYFSGLVPLDVIDQEYHNGGLEIEARTFGGNHFFYFDQQSQLALEFTSSDHGYFKSDAFLTLLNNVNF